MAEKPPWEGAGRGDGEHPEEEEEEEAEEPVHPRVISMCFSAPAAGRPSFLPPTDGQSRGSLQRPWDEPWSSVWPLTWEYCGLTPINLPPSTASEEA